MEQSLLRILEDTQSTAEGPRRAAEEQLANLYADNDFAIALANIASAGTLPINTRQAALTALRRYTSRCWSAGSEDFEGPPANIEVKNRLRPVLLGLVTDEQRKVRTIASAIVGKIATSDFPEEWPTLLNDLLKFITEGNNNQANGALHVLNDVLDEGLGDEQFTVLASQIIEVLHKVATDDRRDISVRSLAVCTFKSCVETLGIMKGNHSEVSDFSKNAIGHWIPFMLSVVQTPLPSGNDENIRGLVSLKTQVLKTIMQIRQSLGSIFTVHIENLFAATWGDMNFTKDRYVQEFVKEEAEGRLVDGDGLPYSLDLLVLEQLDFVQSCLKNKSVRDHLEQAGFAGGNASPFSQMLFATIALAQIAAEDRSMWEIDLNVFLSEETLVSANYAPRTASGDLVLKLGEHFPQQTVQLLLDHTQNIFAASESRELKEAVLFLWDQTLNEFAETGRPIDGQAAASLLGFIVAAIGSTAEGDQFLRARGYSVAATLTKCQYSAVSAQVPELLQQSIHASAHDPSEVVQISAIRAFQKYCDAVPTDILRPYQANVVQAVRNFLNHKSDDDPEDSQDVLTELVQTVSAALTVHYAAILDPNLQIAELLFAIAGNGINNYHLLSLVRDTFEYVCEFTADLFVPLCEKLLPFITQSMDVDPASKIEHPLMGLATDVLAVLLENAPTSSPLPSGLVATVMPRLTRILLESSESDAVQSGCNAFKEIVKHDPNQLFQWHDSTGKPGLGVALIIIDRLLRPDIAESAAMEVGGLAAEIVDKAGDQLGEYLPGLLRAVAERLATAQLPPFVQSLILVFARLVIKQAKDVVDFLASISINGQNGLDVVMKIWLAHASIFSGYEEIKENVTALCHLYNLQDPRLAQIMVQGDIIIPESNRIVTRSKAKQNPDQYTSVSVPVKIVKLLIQELAPNVGEPSRFYGSSQNVDEDGSDDEGWEDVAEGLNVPGMSREELLALGASGRTSRQADDQTYALLAAFFKEVSVNNIGDFQSIYASLKPEEQHQLSLMQ